MAEFVMPALGAAMAAGTLVEWRRKEGDRVTRGDIIAEVETDKGTIDVEVFSTGVIERLLVKPGTKVPVGTSLAVIREEGEERPSPIPSREEITAPPPGKAAIAAEGPAFAVPSGVRASPSARRKARELGVDLSTIQGTGPGGVVTAEDVERTVKGGKPEVPPQTRMRRAIAAAMSLSKREIPHFYLDVTVDLGPALTWLTQENERRVVADRVLPVALFLRAVALAVRQAPELNARWTGDSAPPISDVHLGFAVALRGGGLVAPAIHHADRRSVPEVMASLKDLVERVRSGGLRSSELADPTITVTSLGERGAEATLPIIFPPQVAIVGFGRIVERPWVVDGHVVPRPVVHVSLAADHRVTDGHRAGRFLFTVEGLLAEPAKL